MENASKALIIAGAILLAILIIALGVYLLNGASETAKKMGDMSDLEIQRFNSKFEMYEGTNIPSANVKELIDTVRTHNNANADDVTKQVDISVGTASEDVKVRDSKVSVSYAKLKQELKAGYTYTVTIGHTEGIGTVGQVCFQRDN